MYTSTHTHTHTHTHTQSQWMFKLKIKVDSIYQTFNSNYLQVVGGDLCTHVYLRIFGCGCVITFVKTSTHYFKEIKKKRLKISLLAWPSASSWFPIQPVHVSDSTTTVTSELIAWLFNISWIK
jgi:hypothetical protein